MEKSEDDAEREMEELNREIDEAEQEHQEPEPVMSSMRKAKSTIAWAPTFSRHIQ